MNTMHNEEQKLNKMPIIQRGLANHVDFCPKKARVWKGKPYANLIDDCWGGCEYFIGNDNSEQEQLGNPKHILCSGKNKDI
jgi:hypothetical protein